MHARELAGDGAVDPLPEPDDVALPPMHEVEPSRLAALVDPVTASSHRFLLSPVDLRFGRRAVYFGV
jgi:hypothetical protein